MDNVTTIIKIGAAVLITIGMIAIAVALFGMGADVTKNSENDIKNLSQALVAREYDAYNGTKVSGSNVISAIRMYGETGKLTVAVTTKMSSGSTTYSPTVKYSATDPTSSTYINPVGTFSATVAANTNGVVTGLTFTQN